MEKIRILVGLNMDKKAFDVIEECGQQGGFITFKKYKERYHSEFVKNLTYQRINPKLKRVFMLL